MVKKSLLAGIVLALAGLGMAGLCFAGKLNVEGDLYVQDNIGIGTTTPEAQLHVSGGNIVLDNNRSINWKSDTGMIFQPLIMLDSNNDLVLRGGGKLILKDGETAR